MAGKKKTRKGRKQRKNDNRRLWVSMGILLAFLISAVSILSYLDFSRQKLREWIAPDSTITVPESPADQLAAFNRAIDNHLKSLLQKHGIAPASAQEESRKDSLDGIPFVFKRYEIEVPREELVQQVTVAFQRVAGDLPQGTLMVRKEISKKVERTTLSFLMAKKVTRQVVLRGVAETVSGTPVPGRRGRVAIIVDDIGQSLQPVRELLSMNVSLTFAILPELEHSLDAAKLIGEQHREIMLHLPMEPLKLPNGGDKDPLLTVRMTGKEIRERVEDLLSQIPHVVGVNNHMGSRFTQDRQRIVFVLEELKKRDLFFVDSLTISDSVAFEESRRLGLRSAKRDLFLDHVDRPQSISLQIERLIALAQEKGSAIAICHPRKNTVNALRKAVSEFGSHGIEVVPVSELLGDS